YYPPSTVIYTLSLHDALPIFRSGTKIHVPEEYVNNAWRSLVVGSYMILNGDKLNYSAGNQYARQYVAEIGDSIRSMMYVGQSAQDRKSTRLNSSHLVISYAVF